MTDAARIAAKIALLAFLVSSMLAAGLSLTPHAILAPLRNLRLGNSRSLNFVAAPVFALVLSIVIPLERPTDRPGSLVAAATFLQSSWKAPTATSIAVALMALLPWPPGRLRRKAPVRSTNKNTNRFEPCGCETGAITL